MDAKAIERELRKLVEISPIPCVLTDPWQPGNPIVVANAAFATLTGYAVAQVLGRNCRFLAGRTTEEPGKKALREAVAAGGSAVVELTNYRADGSVFRNAVMIAPIFDGDGKLLFFMGSQMDSSRMSLSERTVDARAKLASLSRRQFEVLKAMANGKRHGQIAHELGITEKTVKMHRKALVTKLGCATSAEAIRIAIESGL